MDPTGTDRAKVLLAMELTTAERRAARLIPRLALIPVSDASRLSLRGLAG